MDGGGILDCMRDAVPGLRLLSDVRLTGMLKDWGCLSWAASGKRGWTFPSLIDMRAAWCERFGEWEWDNDGTDWGGVKIEPPF